MPVSHFPEAQIHDISSLGIDGVNAFLEDVVSSNDPEAPISCGFFRIEAGSPLKYAYSYDECKVMLEGSMIVTEEGADSIVVRPGDVLFFSAGTSVTFATESSGVAFYCGQRRRGVL